jgi:hypothetical protein
MTVRPRDGDREGWMGQQREHRRVRLPEDDLDRRAVAPAHFADDPACSPERPKPAWRALRGLVGGDAFTQCRENLVGPERGAIVKLDVLAKPEGPHESVARDAPACREGGLDVASITERNEALVDEPHRHELCWGRRARRVETRGDSRHADVELTGWGRYGKARDGEQHAERRK